MLYFFGLIFWLALINAAFFNAAGSRRHVR